MGRSWHPNGVPGGQDGSKQASCIKRLPRNQKTKNSLNMRYVTRCDDAGPRLRLPHPGAHLYLTGPMSNPACPGSVGPLWAAINNQTGLLLNNLKTKRQIRPKRRPGMSIHTALAYGNRNAPCLQARRQRPVEGPHPHTRRCILLPQQHADHRAGPPRRRYSQYVRRPPVLSGWRTCDRWDASRLG